MVQARLVLPVAVAITAAAAAVAAAFLARQTAAAAACVIRPQVNTGFVLLPVLF